MAYLKVSSSNHSLTTFATGHVVQTVSTVYHDAGSSSTATTAGQRVASLDHKITPLFANSDILLTASFGGMNAPSSGTTYGIYDFYKYASDVTETYNLSGEGYGITQHTGTSQWQHFYMAYLDTCSENSLSEKTYGISYWGNAASNTYCGWGGGSVITVTAKEIKR